MDLFAMKNQKLSVVDPGMQAGRQVIMQMTTFLSHSGHLTQPTNQEMTNPELTFLTIDVTCMCPQLQRKQLPV